jgi:alpha-tubulin suppressor-like RCC1 family protein
LYGTAKAGSDYSGPTAGTVKFAAGSSSATLSLPALADNVVDPGETIIAQISPSPAYSIAPGQQTATATITAERVVVTEKTRQLLGSYGEYSNFGGFAALKSDGSIVAWGDIYSGGASPSGLTGVTQIYSGNGAFAALKSDGSVVAWGDSSYGGIAPEGLRDVTQIFSNANAFAALKSDGHIVAWGKSDSGGTAPSELSDVEQVFCSAAAFTALKSDGSVVSWGNSGSGGSAPSWLSGVNNIYSNVFSFAALRTDGSVVAWGDWRFGGMVPPGGLSGVTEISSTIAAFAALKSDGTIVAWGDGEHGGTTPSWLTGVSKIYSNYAAFTALKSDGSIFSWGSGVSGGMAPLGLGGVTQIFSTANAFAALRSDGSVTAWGMSDYGGIAPAGLTGVTQIFSNLFAFAALKSDGSVVAWGDSTYGGTAPSGLTDVTQIFSNGGYAFAALKSDGSVVAWGDSSNGGTAPAGLTGVVGFANALTDDFLMMETTMPVVTLSISPSNVKEDDTINIAYTFIRSGPTNAPLTVNYSIEGTADASDYAGATPGVNKTITFGVGSSRVILTIDPIAEKIAEPDETVALTLQAGKGYTIGTSSAVIGTISNDDVVNWISVVSTANGNEADGSPAVFRFSRTGNTSDPLTVSYRLFGTAQAGLDYTGMTIGSITFQAGSSTAQLALPALADGALIDPGETIIARIDASTLYGITPGQQMATATITAEGVAVSVKDGSSGSGERLNVRAFAAIKSDGSVVAWGDNRYGGTAPSGLTGVSQVYSNGTIFAALRLDGTVVDWGNKSELYDVSLPTGLTGVTQIFSTSFAFAALKRDGSVITWGASYWGGRAPSDLTDVKSIYSTSYAFAALKNDGSVVSWGSWVDNNPSGLNDVIAISATREAFAALRGDGTVVAWGWQSDSTVPTGLSGVSKIYSSGDAFAALKNDGTVVAWGRYGNGGTAPYGLSGITQIYSNHYAFAALTADGSVVAWGEGIYGGSAPTGLSGVAQIFSTTGAFAALKTDGTVVAWGDRYFGGLVPQGLNNVTQIFSNGYSFAALKKDGTVVAWGDNFYGGLAPSGLRGVTQIFSSGGCFAALKSDGSVEAWGGNGDDGGNEPTDLKGVVAFANPFTDDRLIPPPTTDGAAIENQGNTKLLRRGDGLAFVEFGVGTRQGITAPWGISTTGSVSSEWQMLAAETITGVNQVLWRNNTASFLSVWNLDANWSLQSTSGADAFNSPRAWELETSFQLDGNRDGIIGNPYTTLEDQGNTKLLRRGDGLAFVEFGAGTRQGITAPWGISTTGSVSSEWQMLAAETITGVNQVLWRNNTASFLHIWNLDANWNLQSTSGFDGFNTPAAWELETIFQVDGNRDGSIGNPFT